MSNFHMPFITWFVHKFWGLGVGGWGGGLKLSFNFSRSYTSFEHVQHSNELGLPINYMQIYRYGEFHLHNSKI